MKTVLICILILGIAHAKPVENNSVEGQAEIENTDANVEEKLEPLIEEPPRPHIEEKPQTENEETPETMTEEDEGEDEDEDEGMEEEDTMMDMAVESDREQVPYEVVYSSEEFELRKIPSGKWVCSKVDGVDVTNDPFEGWQEKYDSAREAKEDLWHLFKESETKCMYKSLKKYFFGVNHGFVEIKKTMPKVTRRSKVSEGVEDMETCIWAGSEWQDKEMPKPGSEKVYIKELPEHYVYSRTAEDCLLSFSDWEKEKDKLVASLGDMKYKDTCFFQAKYKSKHHGRQSRHHEKRKEVWVKVEEADIDLELLKSRTSQEDQENKDDISNTDASDDHDQVDDMTPDHDHTDDIPDDHDHNDDIPDDHDHNDNMPEDRDHTDSMTEDNDQTDEMPDDQDNADNVSDDQSDDTPDTPDHNDEVTDDHDHNEEVSDDHNENMPAEQEDNMEESSASDQEKQVPDNE